MFWNHSLISVITFSHILTNAVYIRSCFPFSPVTLAVDIVKHNGALVFAVFSILRSATCSLHPILRHQACRFVPAAITHMNRLAGQGDSLVPRLREWELS